ncbi:hypothetical protein DPMN_017881 [Dreissena polymorpha]|uniref:Uncharacterized protein n=1 Tax=Dreissena polymorpha TaxID=45954 RepID=A0A9D4S6T8_DREPO|nr:hypothetical protein DPMN_017881 [Dreissena polymorpha]
MILRIQWTKKWERLSSLSNLGLERLSLGAIVQDSSSGYAAEVGGGDAELSGCVVMMLMGAVVMLTTDVVTLISVMRFCNIMGTNIRTKFHEYRAIHLKLFWSIVVTARVFTGMITIINWSSRSSTDVLNLVDKRRVLKKKKNDTEVAKQYR